MSLPAPTDKTLGGVIRDTRERLGLVERRLAVAGVTSSSGGISTIREGAGIDITGTGTPADPLVIAAEPATVAPPLPNPITKFPLSDNNPADAAIGVWKDIAGCAVTMTLTRALWVQVDFGAQISGVPTSYGMIGVVATGALNLQPEVDQATGNANRFGLAPFSTSSNFRIHGVKVFLLPVGTTTLTMQNRRSGSTVAGCDYANMIITPIAWSGAPGAEQAAGGMVGVAATSVSVDQGSAVQLGHKVSFSGVGRVSLNGVFNPAVAEDYVIECVITGATQGGTLRLRKAGVDQAGAVYGNQWTYNTSTSALFTTYAASTGWGFTPVVGQHGKFTAKIANASGASPLTCYLDLDANIQQTSFITNANNKGTSGAAAYDGFSLVTAAATISGWLRVYALT
jgi:hypothetical protein